MCNQEGAVMIHLLDFFCAKIGCAFLSNLHEYFWQSKLLELEFMELENQQYSLAEWNEAVTYILHRTVCFSSPEEAWHYLREQLIYQQNPPLINR